MALRGQSPPHARVLAERIAEYSAASVPLHAADAWTYFGRAMSAMAMGAAEVAQHLLYYAELRAAHALLARHGVVILNNSNFVLDGGGTRTIPIPDPRVARNAHQALWVVFDRWAKLPVAATSAGSIMSVAGVTTEEWVANRPIPSTLGAVMSSLLDQWGLDLKRFSRDRDLRNHLSYDPTRLHQTALDVSPQFIARTFQEVWSLLEPASGNPFETLDLYIARQVFEAIHLGGAGRRSELRRSAYRQMNEQWATSMLGSGRGRYISEFLTYPHQVNDPRILSVAGRDLSQYALSRQLSGMVGRALILLRLATGSLREMLITVGITSADVDFWIGDMLSTHGIAAPDSEPKDYGDLYTGIEDFTLDLERLLLPGATTELADVRTEYASSIEALSSFERVVAWSIA